jgi:hypothetical protein
MERRRTQPVHLTALRQCNRLVHIFQVRSRSEVGGNHSLHRPGQRLCTNDSVDKWSGWINAINPKSGKMAWRVHTPAPIYAALTPTAGNVLFTGDLNGNFLALDARNGKTLYSFDTGGPIAGGVVTYEQKGRQYVAVASGHSGGSIPLTGSATIVIFGQRVPVQERLPVVPRIALRWIPCLSPPNASRPNATSLFGLGVRTGTRSGMRPGMRSSMRSGGGTLGFRDPLDDGRRIVIRAHLRALGLERHETVRTRPPAALAPLLLAAQPAASPDVADCVQRSAKCQKQGQGNG